jgi:hypothetical protein
MLILLFPTVVAALYYDKRVMIVICAESVIVIFFSHILSHFIMFAQILEPFKGIRNIIQFAALLRIFIYLCFAVVFWILSNRTSALMLGIHRVTQEKELIELKSSLTDKVARYEEREKNIEHGGKLSKKEFLSLLHISRIHSAEFSFLLLCISLFCID